MARDSANVDVAKTGTVSYAPMGTTAPTDADSPLGVGWLDVGWISEDGITEARDRSTNNIIGWQGAEIVRVVTTESSATFQFTMIETNENTLELFYGATLNGTDGSIEVKPSESGGRRSFNIDYIDGDKYRRIYVPEGEVTEVGERTLANGDAVGYDVTITGYPNSALDYTFKQWFSDLVAS